MTNIGKLWAGKVYGTNTGNLYIEFQQSEKKLTGTLRFMDDRFGPTVYELDGEYDSEIKVSGKPIQTQEGVTAGNLHVEAKLNSQGQIQGTWKTDLGTGGTFIAFPHDQEVQKEVSNSNIPEQIHTHNIEVGSVRLFEEDIKQLLNYIKQDFLTGRLVITYKTYGGSEVIKYAEDFLKDSANLDKIEYFKVTIEEQEVHGIKRIVIVELRAYGSNDIKVQGVQESWVIGKAENIAGFLRKRQSSLVTKYKKFGLNLNQIIFFAMLVAMPSILSWQGRAVFVSIVVVFLMFLHWMHVKIIPNASIKMSGPPPSTWSRVWPSIVSWVVALTAALVSSLIFYWLTKTP